jgi:hypothetical protein
MLPPGVPLARARRSSSNLSRFSPCLRASVVSGFSKVSVVPVVANSISKLFVPRRRAEDSAVARRGEVDKGTGNLEME